MLVSDASVAVNECRAAPAGMAPSPDNDTAPKAPDKPAHDKCAAPKEKNKDEKTLSDLNDGELKGLLDEAISYKNPKDREGKSKLFNNLLNEAEEDERNARAARAGGSELVRYCNPSAKRNSRHRKKPSSVSENMMHGGSLDNLAKEELFETCKHRTKKSVSARQREGGSLPCNVNSSTIVTQDYQFLEEARKKKEMTEKKSSDVEVQSLLEHDSLAQTYQEQYPSYQTYQTKYTTRASLQITGITDVDADVQFPLLEQSIERKSGTASKSPSQLVGSDCVGPIKILNDTKKVDENGNALHAHGKTKKKKLLTDKNVVVCNAENVKGHRSDIINDMDKLMEFIGITEDQSERNRSIKSKLNRHCSDDSKSKKRVHSSKSKDTRTKLKKSNSLGEISTTNLEDFEFKDKVVMRNKNSDKPRERRSWGTMEPPPFQNLYGNASAENLETAEFRVVTKKKKSKKRRNSINGRTKSSSTALGKNDPRGPSPDVRRKSACSVPHSEKSNDSSDEDSVHSLPIDTQRMDLTTTKLNMPVSYAEMARNNDRPNKEKKFATNDKVPKEQQPTDNIKCASSLTNADANSSVKNTPPDVHNIKNFPAIAKQQVAVNVVDKTRNSNKICKNVNVNKNVKNYVNKMPVCFVEDRSYVQNDFMLSGSHEDAEMCYSSSLPPDIPDVQTIEKMQLMSQGHPENCYDTTTTTTTTTTTPLNNGNDCVSADCDMSERTNAEARPAVVILSGFGNSKEVPGLVFGFDINEQLLSEDNADFCCEDFISRYVPPEVYTTTSHNHDKIVSFIGAAWEEAVVNVSTGKVQYYSDSL